jgi:hypothetical protein
LIISLYELYLLYITNILLLLGFLELHLLLTKVIT